MSTRSLNKQKEIPDFPEWEEISEDWNMGSDAYRALSQFVEFGEVEFAEFGDAGNQDSDYPYLVTIDGNEITHIGDNLFCFGVSIGHPRVKWFGPFDNHIISSMISGEGAGAPQGRVGA